MKKKILGGIAALVIAAVAAFNVGLNSSDKFSDAMLANIEALADDPNDNDDDSDGWFYCTFYPMPVICVQFGPIFDTGYRVYI
ncbi:MAG: NVEALA domain-containing protein [Bacteroidales bacterium]|nr:NVEALA domain-containing protein [Bacteroidales bacterium]